MNEQERKYLIEGVEHMYKWICDYYKQSPVPKKKNQKRKWQIQEKKRHTAHADFVNSATPIADASIKSYFRNLVNFISNKAPHVIEPPPHYFAFKNKEIASYNASRAPTQSVSAVRYHPFSINNNNNNNNTD
eukprot:501078_1